jgi:hypothetical protein
MTGMFCCLAAPNAGEEQIVSAANMVSVIRPTERAFLVMATTSFLPLCLDRMFRPMKRLNN